MKLPTETRLTVYKFVMEDGIDTIKTSPYPPDFRPRKEWLEGLPRSPFHGPLSLLHTSSSIRTESINEMLSLPDAHLKAFSEYRILLADTYHASMMSRPSILMPFELKFEILERFMAEIFIAKKRFWGLRRLKLEKWSLTTLAGILQLVPLSRCQHRGKQIVGSVMMQVRGLVPTTLRGERTEFKEWYQDSRPSRSWEKASRIGLDCRAEKALAQK